MSTSNSAAQLPAPTVRAPERPAGRGTARQSITVSGWTLISRLTGLLRVLALGAVLGPTYFANGAQSALLVPSLVYTVIAGPLVAMVVIPTVVRVTTAAGPDRAAGVLARVSGFMLLVAAGLTVALAVASPLVAGALTLGVPDELAGRARDLAVLLVLIVAPQIVLYVVSAIGVAAQQARNRFALAAAAPAVENLGVIGAVLLAGLMYGTGAEVGTVPVGFVVVLSVGSTLAVGVQAAIQVFGAARVGLAPVPRPVWRDDPDAQAAVSRLLRSVGVAAFPSAGFFTMLVVAGTVPGGVLVLQLAVAVFATLSYLGPRAVSMAAMPLLSDRSGQADASGYAAAWRTGVLYAVMASAPFLVLLAVFAEPVAALLTYGEADRGFLVLVLAACLVVVAFAQLFGGLHDIGRQALFARLDDRGPLLASTVALVTTLGIAAVALWLAEGPTRLVVITCAILVAEVAGALVVLVRLRSAIRPEPMVDLRHVGVLLIGSLVLLAVALGGRWVLTAVEPSRFGALGLMVPIGLAAVAAYAGAMWLVGVRGSTGPA